MLRSILPLLLFLFATRLAVEAAYSGDIGWVFTGDNVSNTAGDEAGVGGGDHNTAQGTGTFTLGGTTNSASGTDSFIGGGRENTVEQASQASMIGGGELNLVGSRFAIVGGGLANSVTENYGALIGGYKGAVNGKFGSVVGGSRNVAQGKISSAHGFKAKALHDYALVLGFGGSSGGDCESTASNQVAMCVDSWKLNGQEMIDLFTRRDRRVLLESSAETLATMRAREDQLGDKERNGPPRRLGARHNGAPSDAPPHAVTEEDIATHEQLLAGTQARNAELAETISLLSKEIEALAAAQAKVAETEELQEHEQEEEATAVERRLRRRALSGADVEYVLDDTVTSCTTEGLIASSGSGMATCESACDALPVECGAFMLDGSNDCHTFYVCSGVTGTGISTIEGDLYHKRRVAPSAYEVDYLAHIDYELLLAEDAMDDLEYETSWGEILSYTSGDSCDSGGEPYLAMDADTSQLHLCDGAGTWSQVSLLDTIPSPELRFEPAPWHDFDPITQDVWAGTDTHRYTQSGPLEEEVKPHDADQCDSAPCENGGTCYDHGGALTENDPFDTFSCDCATGFDGVTCSDPIDDCALSPCANGATCVSDGYGYVCECAAGYSGFDCDVDIDECQYAPCQRGTCTDEVDGYSCVCEAGWSGDNCEVFDKSEGYYLVGTGRCTDPVGTTMDTCSSTDATVDTLYECLDVCDATAECDAVEFFHSTPECSLVLALGAAPSGLDAHFSCAAVEYQEFYREDFEGGSPAGDWAFDPDSVLLSTGIDDANAKAGTQAFRLSGGASTDPNSVYRSSLTLNAGDGIVSGTAYSVAVWVYQVSEVVAGPQPAAPTGNRLLVADSTGVFTSTASALGDARGWELLSTTFTAQSDEILVISLDMSSDYEFDTYWDDLVVWTGPLYTTGADGSLTLGVECYRAFETPVATAFTSCELLKYAGEPDGAYEVTDANSVTHEYYCRGEDGGGKSRTTCTSKYACDTCSPVLSESSSWAAGLLDAGLAQFADSAGWLSTAHVRFEWYDAAGEWVFVQFVAPTTIFVDRPNNAATGQDTDNTLLALSAADLTTNIDALATSVSNAAGATFCLSNTNHGGTVAWAIVPADNSDWSDGCVGGGTAGEGVFYGGQTAEPGFVGYRADGEVKSISEGATHLSLYVYVCHDYDQGLPLWLDGADIIPDDDDWPDHRGSEYSTVAISSADLTQDSSTDAYLLTSTDTQFDVGEDIGSSAAPDLTMMAWVKLRSVDVVKPGTLLSHDDGGGLGRSIFLHDTAYGTDGGSGQGAVGLGVGTTYTSDLFLDVDEWYHVAGVWRSDLTATLFINGVAFELDVTTSNDDGLPTVTVGGHPTAFATDHVDAWLGELKIYDVALTQIDITAAWAAGLTRFV